MPTKTNHYDATILTLLNDLLAAGKKPLFRVMVNRTGFSEHTIVKAIKRLEDDNRISVQREHSNTYQVLDPPTPYETMIAAIYLAEHVEQEPEGDNGLG